MKETRWLDADEAAVWQSYRELLRELQGALNRQLVRDSGLSAADYALLAPLSESASGVLRARDLGRTVGWERSRLSHQITRMENRGLVRRELCENDARGYMVRLTRAGRKAIEAAAPEHVATVRRYFFDPLTKRETKTLGLLLGKLLTALDEAPDRPD